MRLRFVVFFSAGHLRTLFVALEVFEVHKPWLLEHLFLFQIEEGVE